MNEIRTNIEVITPQTAKIYLQENYSNRSLSPSTVHCYATDMKNGDWLLNGEAICFDQEGRLRNGQHRLQAVIESETPTEFVVIRNIPNSNAEIYDRGRGRTVRDTLLIRKYSKQIAKFAPSIVRIRLLVEKKKDKPSDSEIQKFIDEHIDYIEKIVSISGNHEGTVNISAAWFQYPLLAALENGEQIERLAEFAYSVRTGHTNNAEKDSAAITLRNDVINESIVIRGGREYRKHAVMCVENAIYDFCRFKQRKRTYSKSDSLKYMIQENIDDNK